MSANNIIKRISINREIEKAVNVPFNRARIELYKNLPERVADEQEFYKTITQIIQFFEILNSQDGVASNDAIALQKAEEILETFNPGGIIGSLEASTTGMSGGLLAVASNICQSLIRTSRRRYFSAILRDECSEFNPEKKVAFISEYLRLKGLSIPRNMRNMRPEELVGRYKEIIMHDIQHSETIKRALGI